MGLRTRSQFVLVALSVGHAEIARLQGRDKRPEDRCQDEGRQYDQQYIAHVKSLCQIAVIHSTYREGHAECRRFPQLPPHGRPPDGGCREDHHLMCIFPARCGLICRPVSPAAARRLWMSLDENFFVSTP